MLLRLRGDLTAEHDTRLDLSLGIKGWSIAMQSPTLYALSGKAASAGSRLAVREDGQLHALPGLLGNWTKNRDFPPFAPKSFHQLWRERPQASHEQPNADS
jgi:L-lactate dehydrogenase complex protein LldF